VIDVLQPAQTHGDIAGVPATRSEIGEAARICLRRQPRLALAHVWCEYRAGVLVLRGHVPTYFLKQLAQETVRRVDGVEVIENDIEVEPQQAPHLFIEDNES
jgi:osmotically-inducible protein OsmY